jgi:hypothetical protein
MKDSQISEEGRRQRLGRGRRELGRKTLSILKLKLCILIIP